MTDEPITFAEAARIAGVTWAQVRRTVNEGRLQTVVVDGRVMTTRAAVDAWLAARRKPGRPKKEERA